MAWESLFSICWIVSRRSTHNTRSIFRSAGFGCGTYQGTDVNGAPKPTDESSIDMPAFLRAVDEKRVEKVELKDGGNVGYAFVRDASTPASGEGAGGAAAAAAEVTRLRIGEGFPVDNPKAWSSPLWVVRVLKDGPPKF